MSDAPDSLLARHPEPAYLWGHVAGNGTVADDHISVEVSDEQAARRLAAIAGGAPVDHHVAERSFAHDATVTRREDAYTVTIDDPSLAARAAGALGLPTEDSDGGYRFAVFEDHRRQLLRGLLESCGVVCFRESESAVGISFVHADRSLLERIGSLLAAADIDSDPIEESSSGGYWFGVADDDAAAFAEWVYDGADASGLYATDRRQKALRSVERAQGLSVGELSDTDTKSPGDSNTEEVDG